MVSTKPQTVVYILNPKAVWSDGVPITAKDFIYAWTQQRGDPTSDPTSVASTAGYRDIKSIKGSNKGRTVTVVFRTPFADWEMLFSDLLPAHIMEKTGWNPACKTVDPAIDLSGGPFRIAKVTAQSVVLRSNPRWFGTKPNVRRITVDIAADATQLAQWVRTNKVQVALPGELTPAFLDQMTSLPGVQSQIALSGTILEMEMASGPDSRLTPDMRLAIALSVDRQALTTRQANWALSSVQVAASHIYAQGQSGYQPTPSTTPTTTPANPDDLDLDVDHARRPGGQRQFPRHAQPHPGLRPHGGLRVLPGRDRHVAQRLRRAADPEDGGGRGRPLGSQRGAAAAVATGERGILRLAHPGGERGGRRRAAVRRHG